MKCTIKNIAAELNLSRNTVSKALNGGHGVSDSTRRLVQEKAKENPPCNFTDGYCSHVHSNGCADLHEQ